MKKHPGQRFAFAVAILCYIAAAGCVLAALLSDADASAPITAALMASVVFFGGCGIVLNVIGTARLKGIISDYRQFNDDQQA